MDVAGAEFKYDEMKEKLRHLSGKFLTLVNPHAACTFCDTQSSYFPFSESYIYSGYFAKTRKLGTFVQNLLGIWEIEPTN